MEFEYPPSALRDRNWRSSTLSAGPKGRPGPVEPGISLGEAIPIRRRL